MVSRRASASRGDRHAQRGGKPIASSNPGYRSQTAIPAPDVPEGRLRCEVCRNHASLTPRGNLYAHRDLFGYPCGNKRPPGAVVQPVAVPPLLDGGVLSPKGRCYECDRPVSGERKFCGQCLRKRQ